MSKKFSAIVAVLLCAAMIFAFAGCGAEVTDASDETTIKIKTPDLPTEQLYSVDSFGETIYVDAEGNELSETTTLNEAGILAKNTRLLDYYNVNVNALGDGSTTAIVKRSEKKSIGKQTDAEGNSVKMSENAQINAAIDTLKKYMLITAEDKETEYTNELKDALPGTDYVSMLTIDQIENSTCVDGDTTRTITLTLKSPVPEAVIDENFEKEDIDAIYAEFDKAADYMTIDKANTKFEYVNCTIEVVADLETDNIISIKYTKGVNVNTAVTGTGTLESVGTVPVQFLYTYTVSYSIDRTAPEAEAAE